MRIDPWRIAAIAAVAVALAANAGFSAIASSGAANTLTIVEFF